MSETREGAVKQEALRLGFSSVGICKAGPAPHHAEFARWLASGRHAGMSYLERQLELRADPSALLAGVRSIIAVTLNYNTPNPRKPGLPRIARYALGRDYHRHMRSRLQALGRFIQSIDSEAFCRACVDSAPIAERDFAHLAGLGWFGKNTCLIDSRRGSWFFIGLLLTTMELQPDAPSDGGCGTCSKCVDACPTGAIVFEDARWQVNSGRCISYLTIEHRGPLPEDLANRIGDWTFGCDICQEVCPFNEPRDSQPSRAAPSADADVRQTRAWPRLEDLARIGHGEWDVLTRGSAVRRAGWEGLRRNASANLANRTAARPSSDDEEPGPNRQ